MESVKPVYCKVLQAFKNISKEKKLQIFVNSSDQGLTNFLNHVTEFKAFTNTRSTSWIASSKC